MGINIIKQIKSKTPTLSVNIVDCDLLNLSKIVEQIDGSGLELIHFDVKDGCFVPHMTFGPCVIKAINSKLIKDVHLMIHDPAEKYMDFINSGADIITIHIESDYNLHETLTEIGKAESINHPGQKIIRGLAMNPDIPVEDLAPFLEDVEMVTVMTYNPKVKNGKTDDKLRERIIRIKKMIDYTKKDILLSIKGGINEDNIREYIDLGADILVTGRIIFKNNSIINNINELLSVIR